MFSSLYAAKKSGAIAFDWFDTGVIVHGTDAFGHIYYYGVLSVQTKPDSPLRPVYERQLATRVGVLSGRKRIETEQ